jgi:hypothetical protein
MHRRESIEERLLYPGGKNEGDEDEVEVEGGQRLQGGQAPVRFN